MSPWCSSGVGTGGLVTPTTPSQHHQTPSPATTTTGTLRAATAGNGSSGVLSYGGMPPSPRTSTGDEDNTSPSGPPSANQTPASNNVFRFPPISASPLIAELTKEKMAPLPSQLPPPPPPVAPGPFNNRPPVDTYYASTQSLPTPPPLFPYPSMNSSMGIGGPQGMLGLANKARQVNPTTISPTMSSFSNSSVTSSG